MAKVLRVMSLVAVTTLASVAAAQAQTPLNATFRDATSDTGGVTGDVTEDAVKSDGSSYNGVRSWSVKRSVFYDGAFINSNGGIEINLEPECSPNTTGCLDRALRIQLLGYPSTNVPSACFAPFREGGVLADDVDFRFNVTGGIESLPVPVRPEDRVATDAFGVINFRSTVKPSTVDPNTSWALLVNTTYGGLTPGDLTITRTGADSWTVDSHATVLLQCTTTVNRRQVRYDVGSYAVPFQLNVTR
jgi:hypothetical protein